MLKDIVISFFTVKDQILWPVLLYGKKGVLPLKDINPRRIYYTSDEDLREIIKLKLVQDAIDWLEDDLDALVFSVPKDPINVFPVITRLYTATQIEEFRNQFNELCLKRLLEKQDMTEIKKRQYVIRVESPFIITPTEAKKKFGIGFSVLNVEVEKEVTQIPVKDHDSAIDAIILAGYRSLARAYHPDLGGDPNIMMEINQAKKELQELIKELRNS